MKGYVDLGEDRPFEPKKNRDDITSRSRQYTSDENESSNSEADSNEEIINPESPIEREENTSRKKLWIFGSLITLLVLSFIASRLLLGESKFERLIVTGNQTVSEEVIVRLIKKWQGQPLSTVSISAISDTLQSEPFIAKALVSRELPDAIRVEVIEEIPVAMASVNGKWVMISGEGTLLPFVSDAMKRSGRIPVLSGFQKVVKVNGKRKIDSLEASEALFFLKELQKSEFAKMIIAEINISNPKRIVALTSDGDTRFYVSGGAVIEEESNGEMSDRRETISEMKVKRYQDVLVGFETFWKEVITKKGVNAFEYVDLRYSGKVFAKASQYER